MLKGTSHKPDEIVNPKMGPMERIETVEKVAINAVMAGCKPEQLPLCLAITEGDSRMHMAVQDRWASLILSAGPSPGKSG
jgi:hypothetical protein